jgi:hypothetical protein
MPKILILLILLSSCADLDFESPKKSNSSKPTIQKTTRNKDCFESSKFKISKVFKNGVLAKLCPAKFKSYYDDAFEACYNGSEIYLPVDPAANDYVDNQKVTLSSDVCLSSDGVQEFTDNTHSMLNEAFRIGLKARGLTDNEIKKLVNKKVKTTRIRKVKIISSEALNPLFK